MTNAPTPAEMAVNLRECPFCGTSNLTVDNWAGWYVRCNDCDVKQTGSSKDIAIHEWNTRAAQPSAGAEPVAEDVVWERSGTDVNGDPLKLTARYGDMDVQAIKSRGSGLWNVSGYILGRMGMASEAEAVEYAETQLQSEVERRVRAAHTALSLFATPVQPDSGGVVEALREAREILDSFDCALTTDKHVAVIAKKQVKRIDKALSALRTEPTGGGEGA